MARHAVVTLFDVDNTLLDNDHVVADLRRYLAEKVGNGQHERYWELFEELRVELGYADYLGALQRFRVENLHRPHLLDVSLFLLGYPFANRLFPSSLDAVEHARTWGAVAVLSDGDVVFQPLKVERSGLFETFRGNVLIYIHKEQELADVARRFPAEHYVFVDDKPRLCAAIKAHWGARVTTVFPRQGHYAHDAAELAKYPPPDVTIAHTNGKMPFLKRAGGVFHPDEVTISIGVKDVRALAHEFAHFLDFQAGHLHGKQTRRYSKSNPYAPARISTSLADADAHDRAYGTSSPGAELLREATRTISNTYVVERQMRGKLDDIATEEGKREVRRARAALGSYWREPCEVFARTECVLNLYAPAGRITPSTISHGSKSCSRFHPHS